MTTISSIGAGDIATAIGTSGGAATPQYARSRNLLT